jgi:hypothetical protein
VTDSVGKIFGRDYLVGSDRASFSSLFFSVTSLGLEFR